MRTMPARAARACVPSIHPLPAIAMVSTRHLLCALPCVALAARVQPLAAQQPDTASHLRFTGDVGVVYGSGNTSVTTLNLGENIGYAIRKWGITQSLQSVYGKSNGVESANEWHALVRGDRALDDGPSLYVLGAYDRNPYAGIARRFEEGAGLGDKVLRAVHDTIALQAGLSFTQQRTTDDSVANFPSARGEVTYTHHFAKTSYVLQDVEVLPDLRVGRNLRVNSTSALVAPLSKAIALKVSYVVRFDNLPPPTFKKTDKLLTSGLQVTF